MIHLYDDLYKDFEAVNKISIVPMILEVICQTTGMGFAAVARLTEERWLACSVRDELSFGLKAGGEIELETMIGNEILETKQPVIIDQTEHEIVVKIEDTPKIYGIQSYISFPIILKNGVFFGALCAIDVKPAKLNDPKIIGLFNLFTELLALHLQSLELMERSHFALRNSNDQNILYKQISNHNLQEPLRKIKIFSNLLSAKADVSDASEIRHIADKINIYAHELSNMMLSVTQLSELNNLEKAFEHVNLSYTLDEVCRRLALKLLEKRIEVIDGPLPTISAIPAQMEQFFFLLLSYIITFTIEDEPSFIRIYTKEIEPDAIKGPLAAGKNFKFCNIFVEYHHKHIDQYFMRNIFDVFIHSTNTDKPEQYDAGLAFCRKVIHNHGGLITAELLEDSGVSFSIILPVGYKRVLNLPE